MLTIESLYAAGSGHVGSSLSIADLVAALYFHEMKTQGDDRDRLVLSKGHAVPVIYAALAELGLKAPKTPSPWNLFMNIPVQADGRLSFEPPVCKPGDYVLLRAEMDCVIVFSACPQDMVPINGVTCTPTEAHAEILSRA